MHPRSGERRDSASSRRASPVAAWLSICVGYRGPQRRSGDYVRLVNGNLSTGKLIYDSAEPYRSLTAALEQAFSDAQCLKVTGSSYCQFRPNFPALLNSRTVPGWGAPCSLPLNCFLHLQVPENTGSRARTPHFYRQVDRRKMLLGADRAR